MSSDSSTNEFDALNLPPEYEVLRELGRGGTAIVYLARDRDLGREVAVKVIQTQFVEDENMAERLSREARTVAKLQHPNIASVFATRRLSDGRLAMVMEYIPGPTLKRAIRRRGPLPFDYVERVLRDMAHALAHAHERRIIHRDIKPENIYLHEEDGRAMLADFGIARLMDADAGLTIAGMSIGTPAYMAPEQIEGGEVGPYSDLYSLGMVGYEMLTGRRPWEGETLYSIIYKQKHESLPPLGDLRARIPGRLREVVEGAMHKDPARRWAAATDILACLDGEPVSRPVAPPEVTDAAFGEDAATAEPVDEASQTLLYRKSEDADAVPTASEPPPSAPLPPAQEPIAPSSPRVARRSRRRKRGARVAAVLALALLLGASGVLLARLTETDAELDPVAAEPPVELEAETSGADGLAGVPARAIVEGSDQEGFANTPLEGPLSVLVSDMNGDPVEGVGVRFSIRSGGGLIEPESALTDADGVAEAVWTLGQTAGLDTAMIRVPRVSDEVVMAQATVGAGEPARVVAVASPTRQAAPGSELPGPVAVRVEDEFGNVVPGAPVEFRIDTGGGSLATGTATTNSDGVAQTRWTLGGSAGEQSLAVLLPGLPAGELALTATAVAPAPTVPAATGTLAAGGTHTCVLGADGGGLCWGGNDSGQLGDASGRRQFLASGVTGGHRFTTMEAGVSHTCALAENGAAFCWGAGGDGQLGNGGAAAQASPEPAAGDLRFRGLAAGLAHTCGITSTGEAYCWGAGGAGQLGSNVQGSRTEATPVDGGHSFSRIVAGWNHTCAIDQQGATRCWGQNGYGQLGDGSRTNRAPPTAVLEDPGFSRLTAGGAHTCGIANGVAYCWGRNQHGQLGDGTTSDRTTLFRVVGERRYTRVTAGSVHSCGIASDGGAYCWGRNNYGQLGNGSTDDSAVPVRVEGDQRFTDLQATGAHTCGVTQDGQRLCWGYNAEGQLGDGTSQNRSRPVRVRSG